MLVLNVATYFSLALGNNHMQILQVFLRDSFLHYGTLKLEENIPNVWRGCQQLERLQGANGPSALVNQAAGGLYLVYGPIFRTGELRELKQMSKYWHKSPRYSMTIFVVSFGWRVLSRKQEMGPVQSLLCTHPALGLWALTALSASWG